MRDIKEVEFVGSIMEAVLGEEFSGLLDKRTTLICRVISDACCWFLNHPHKTELADIVQQITREMVKRGAVISGLEEEKSGGNMVILPEDLANLVKKKQISIEEAKIQLSDVAKKKISLHQRPKDGFCRTCGISHHPSLPHDPASHYYRTNFASMFGMFPTWEDATSHCSEPLQGKVASILSRYGQWPVPGNLTSEAKELLALAFKSHLEKHNGEG